MNHVSQREGIGRSQLTVREKGSTHDVFSVYPPIQLGTLPGLL